MVLLTGARAKTVDTVLGLGGESRGVSDAQLGSTSFLLGVRFREGEAPAEPPGLCIPGLYHTYTNSRVAHHRDKALSDSRLGRSLALPIPYRCAGDCRKSSHSSALISGTAHWALESN